VNLTHAERDATVKILRETKQYIDVRSIDDFIAHFGAHPVTVYSLVNSKGFNLHKLLIFFHYCKVYPLLRCLRPIWKIGKTKYMKIVDEMIDLLFPILSKIVCIKQNGRSLPLFKPN